MSLLIIPFQSSINTCYLLKDQGAVLVDAGNRGCAKSFARLLALHEIKPEEIQLIIPTHGDFDHAGGAKELKELTGAKIVMHKKDKDFLELGIFNFPKGVTPWGRISRTLLKPMAKMMGEFPATNVDIVLGNDNFSLEEYGIPGKIVHTPGHTFGSISVVMDSGDAFVGCLAHNMLPLTLKPKLPVYAMDLELLKESWVKVINLGARIIYPGHGKPFPLEKITKYLN